MKHESPEFLELLAARFSALADVTRLRMMQVLHDSDGMNVSQLAQAVGILQPSASKHLGVLKQAGLVKSRRHENQVIYAANDHEIYAICELICSGVRKHVDQIASVASTDLRPRSHRRRRH